MNNSDLFFNTDKTKKIGFELVLKEIQEFISLKYAALFADGKEEQQTKEQIRAIISKYLLDHKIQVEDMQFEQLVDKLYEDMIEFSFITPYLYRTDIEELDINSWKDIKVIYSNGQIVPLKERFQSPEYAVDVIRRLLHKSGMILDYAQPFVRGHLSNNIRITVFGNPVTDKDKGIAASIRIVNPQKLAKQEFIQLGTATEEMLNLLNVFLKYGVSICITGSTGSGKTTLMGWLLSEMPNDKRIFTIENDCREFDLVKEDGNGNIINNVIHTCTRYSDDPKQNIDQEKLLEGALTSNPDIICVSEMKSAEAFAAQEAARTGHAVVTTIHANSCEATYARMETLCKQKYDLNDKTLHKLVTEAFPIVVFIKKLEDNSRKIMEVTECEILPSGERKLHTLYRFNVIENKIMDDGKIDVIGGFEKVNDISKSLQKRFQENGMPMPILNQFISRGENQ